MSAYPDLCREQVSDRLAPVVHDAGALEHAVAAATRLAVAVQRQREAVRRGDGATAEREPANALPRGLRQVDRVRHAAHDVEVEARHAVVDQRRARLIRAEIAGRLLQIGPELAPGDAHRPQRVLVRVHARHVAFAHLAFRKARAQVRARSCAAENRRTTRGCSATVASGISSGRIDATRYAPVSLTRETCTTARLSAKFRGWTKCTPFTT